MNMDLGSWSARVAAVVREEMVAQQCSVRTLADVLGVTEPTVRTRLDGRKPFDLVELERVAAWLDTTPSELLARAGDHAS